MAGVSLVKFRNPEKLGSIAKIYLKTLNYLNQIEYQDSSKAYMGMQPNKNNSEREEQRNKVNLKNLRYPPDYAREATYSWDYERAAEKVQMQETELKRYAKLNSTQLNSEGHSDHARGTLSREEEMVRNLKIFVNQRAKSNRFQIRREGQIEMDSRGVEMELKRKRLGGQSLVSCL